MSSRTVVLTLVAVLSATPLVGAWGGFGSYEPDTNLDVSDDWMHETPDVTKEGSPQNVNKVYLNGWLGQCVNAVAATSCPPVNPNVAALRTGVRGSEYLAYALLGVWKDCNKDGVIGMADHGLFEYRTELLNGDESVCPGRAIPAVIPKDWFPPHNDKQWVHELIPIQWTQWDSVVGDANPFNLNGNGSRVWADFGLPGKGYSANCYYRSAPSGTYHSTGGILRMYDCIPAYATTDTYNDAVAAVGGDDLSLGQLSFADKPREQDQSASVANQRNPWGEEEDTSFVEAWDCSVAPTRVWVDFEGSTGGTVKGHRNVTNVSQPSGSPQVGTTGSAAGTMNSTMSGRDQCHRRPDVNGGGDGGSYARYPYANAGETTTLISSVRVQSDVMTPSESQRPAAPFALALGKGVPPDLGLRELPGGGADGLWSGNRIYHIDDVFLDPSTGQPRGASYVTTYAYVATADITKYSLSMPKGGSTGSYGSEACGTRTTGVSDGWDCDATHWYKDAEGNDIRPRSTRLGPAPGVSIASYPASPYNLRDVDCYDESLAHARETGVSYALVGGSRCASPRAPSLV